MDKPKLIVFDLDYTLWPFWVDTHVTPPFHKSLPDKITDAEGNIVKCYKEVPAVLEQLHDHGYKLGIASRTSEIKGANQLLKLFDWNKYFSYKQIFPGGKKNHFEQFKKQSQLPYSAMLFFDDEQRNIAEVTSLGVFSVLVTDGVTRKLVEDSLKKFRFKF